MKIEKLPKWSNATQEEKLDLIYYNIKGEGLLSAGVGYYAITLLIIIISLLMKDKTIAYASVAFVLLSLLFTILGYIKVKYKIQWRQKE